MTPDGCAPNAAIGVISLWKSDDLPKQHEKGSWKMRKFVLLVACIRLSKRAAGAKGVRVGAKKNKSQQNNRSTGFCP